METEKRRSVLDDVLAGPVEPSPTTPQRKSVIDSVLDGPVTTQSPEAAVESEQAPTNPAPLGLGDMGKQALQNFPRSAKEYGSTLIQPLVHPIETAKGLGALGKGIAYKFKPGYQPEEDIPDAVWEKISEEYGGIENIKRTFAENPVQVTADIASILLGVGFVSKAGKASKLAKTATAIGEAVEPSGLLLKPIKAAGAAMDLKLPGQLSQRISERLYGGSLKPSTTLSIEKRREILQTGIQNKIVPTEQGLMKIRNDMDKLNNKINKMIDASAKKGGTLDTDKIVARLDDLREYYKNTIDPTEALDSLDALADTFKKHHGSEISVDKAQKIKKHTYYELKKSYGEIKNHSKEGQKAIARGIKEELETIFPEIKALNKKDGALIEFEKQLERSIARIGNRDVFGIGGGLTPIKIIVDSPMLKSRLAFIIGRARKNLLKNPNAAAKLGIYQTGRITESPMSRTLPNAP